MHVELISENWRKQVYNVVQANDTEPACIFKVDDAVANIVGSFNQECKRVPLPNPFIEFYESELFGYFSKLFLFRLKVSELLLTLSFLDHAYRRRHDADTL